MKAAYSWKSNRTWARHRVFIFGHFSLLHGVVHYCSSVKPEKTRWAVNLWVSVKCSDSECGLGMEVEI